MNAPIGGTRRASLGARATPHNLPAHRVRLIGRESDLTAARQALLGAEGRLLTFTGTGGCGKTRLAVELASSLLEVFPDGVWLVELSPLSDPNLVPQTVISALGLREQPGEAGSQTLVGWIGGRRLLLLLDNCEHLIDACAELADALLDKCPNLHVLATSREPLRITSELIWRVPSLAVPDLSAGPAELLRMPAVQLFVERAQAVQVDFPAAARAHTVARICARVDGLPLAIELAAARARTLGVEQILSHLDDAIRLLVGGSRTAPARQQTLRATLDWSHGLLSDQERAVFRRLAVFAESFSLDAAEAICTGRDVTCSEVLDVIHRLIDKSLVVMNEQNGSARYRLLEPVGQYAQEWLTASGERDVIRRRHALHYLWFCEARSTHSNIGGPRRFSATSEMAREYPNIRCSLAWCVENKETQLGLGLAGSLNFLWQMSDSLTEGLEWVERLLGMPGAEEPTVARAWAMLAGAYLARLHGDFDIAAAFCQEVLPLGRGLGEPLLEWMALQFLAVTNLSRGLPIAERYARQAIACAHKAGAPVCEGRSLMTLGFIECQLADWAAGQSHAEQALRLARGDGWIEGWIHAVLGHAALGQGALEPARAALETGLALARQLGSPPDLTPFILDNLAEVEAASGQQNQSRAWLVKSLEARRDSGERLSIGDSLERLAALAAARRQPELALRLAGAVDALYEELGIQHTPEERQKLNGWLQPVRETLAAETADRAWMAGRALDMDEAITLAIDNQAAGTLEGQRTLAARAASRLTPREQQVAMLVTRGLTNREIAEQLVITERTVATHIEHILNKLGFASRHQVGAWVTGHGLLS